VFGTTFNSDGSLLATAHGDKTVRFWDVATGTIVRPLTGHTEAVRGVAFSLDGNVLATASWDCTARLWK
jgi:WD40 repeat protein